MSYFIFNYGLWIGSMSKVFLLSTTLPTKRFESDLWSANCGYFLQRMQKLILLSKVSLYRNHGKSINHVCWNSRFRFFSYCLSFSACDFRFSGLSLFGAVAMDSFLGVFMTNLSIFRKINNSISGIQKIKPRRWSRVNEKC